jgi:hypothetical protein
MVQSHTIDMQLLKHFMVDRATIPCTITHCLHLKFSNTFPFFVSFPTEWVAPFFSFRDGGWASHPSFVWWPRTEFVTSLCCCLISMAHLIVYFGSVHHNDIFMGSSLHRHDSNNLSPSTVTSLPTSAELTATPSLRVPHRHLVSHWELRLPLCLQ